MGDQPVSDPWLTLWEPFSSQGQQTYHRKEITQDYILLHFSSRFCSDLVVYCTTEKCGGAWTDGANSGAIGVRDFVH